MADTYNIREELRKFGLSSNQVTIYMLLVKHKELRIQEIAKLSGIPRSSVYESLKRLFELGIAEEVIEDSYKKIRPYSVGVMHHGLDEELLKLKRLKDDLKELEQAISLEPAVGPTDKSVVRYYKDRSGAQQLYWNSLKAKNTVYVMSDWGRGRYVGMRFYEKFVDESRTRKIAEKVLINPTDYALESIRQYTYPGSVISRTRLEDIRAIDPKYVVINGDTLIYNNIYATVYLKTLEINGFEIETPHFVSSQRAIFETLWELARPVTELL
jgi:sugar-specific transcriptional regulator TrmB